MYVTLEPCAHVGRTPACAHRLVEYRVPRVVIGCVDPNPLVAGKGIAILEQAGIQVTSGVLQQECRDLARVFMVNQTEQRPYILLKWAETQDGYLDNIRTCTSPALKISSPFTQMLVHRQRSRYGAIVIGANTFLLDQPSLTNRLWIGGSPRPIIIDPRARCHKALSKRSDAERWSLVCLDSSAPQSPTPYTLITSSTRSGLLSTLLQWLYQQEYMSLIVEGGSEMLKVFIQAGLYDAVRIEKSPYPLNHPKGIIAPELPDLRLCNRAEYDQRTIYLYTRLQMRLRLRNNK